MAARQPTLEDIGAYKILDAVGPIVMRAGIGFSALQWRQRNKAAALSLYEAGKSPEDCARLMDRAINHGGRFYGGIRTLAKLQEHWGPIEKLERTFDDDDPPSRDRVQNTVLR